MDASSSLISAARANNKWDRAAINALLLTNDRAVERALVVIYSRQTAAERLSASTVESNGFGFSGLDAEIFSSFAVAVLKGYRLSAKQLAVCRKVGKNGVCRLARYHAQLAQEIAAKAQPIAA